MNSIISKRLARNLEGILAPRDMCFACYRPSDFCVCNLVPKFDAHCNILLLQHPHERKKYHSTSKVVANIINNSQIRRGIIFDEADLLQTQPKSSFYILYPGPEALDAEEITLNKQDTLIVIDGTWVEARKIMYRNPFLRSLKKVSFKDTLRSQYHIRKQPKDFCLSTLECIAYALQKTAPSEELYATYASLFEAFNNMVQRQLAFFPRNRPLTL